MLVMILLLLLQLLLCSLQVVSRTPVPIPDVCLQFHLDLHLRLPVSPCMQNDFSDTFTPSTHSGTSILSLLSHLTFCLYRFPFLDPPLGDGDLCEGSLGR